MTSNLKNLTNEKNFDDITKEWLLYKKPQIKEPTYRLYEYRIQKYLKDYFNESLEELENFNYNLFINELLKKYKIKTVRDIITILKSILKYAERKYDLNFKLDLIVMPRLDNNKIEILTKDEEQKIKEFCSESLELKDIGILICLYTGIRIGEICALTWKNIDLENKVLHVVKTIERVYTTNKKTYIYIGEPKSRSSYRSVPLKESLVVILKEMKDKNNPQNDMFFLTERADKFIEPRNYQYWFKNRLKKINVKNKKFHILRHTFATNCIQIGMDVKSLSEILGHANANITLDKYVHSSYEIQKKYLERL